MRPSAERNGATSSADLRRQIGRLDGLPIRPLTARAALEAFARQDAEPEGDPVAPKFLGLDPGWVLQAGEEVTEDLAMGLIAERTWWRRGSKDADEALERLWRHAVATSSAARRLAVEAKRDDAPAIARAALLHQLGLWAVAAIAPEALVELLAIAHPRERRERERVVIGKEAIALGRELAERWGCGALVAEAAWLHADESGDLSGCSQDPEAIGLIQKAFALAERTPWSLSGLSKWEPASADPRLRILIAEVQVKCGAGLLDPDASIQEEAISRNYAKLTLNHRRVTEELAAKDLLLTAIAEHEPTDSPEAWAERAALAWCRAPGVTSAQVEWQSRPRAIELENTHRSGAKIRLRSDPAGPAMVPSSLPTVAAWSAFAALVADRDLQVRRLDSMVQAHRERVDRDAISDRTSKLEALAEFAAGAGHELNNPLAVILGRAQLLVPVVDDANALRSLRIIIAQAQRAHRILRDLMYVARPPAHRPRPCQPDEIIRACVRDLKDEAAARGIRLIAEVSEPVPIAWADPDPLRHMADLLVRNAMEATPSGGTIRLITGKAGDQLSWTIKDSGRGISASESTHLFDPFYCGRQAGRGLGLGLSRVARFVSRSKGELGWRSTPGRGTVFSVTLPIDAPDS